MIYDQAVATVEEMVERDERLERIEDFIQRLEATGEIKSALWLVAWAEQARSRAQVPCAPLISLPDAW